MRTSAKVGRNDPCPCGSGRKYKACHLDDDVAAAAARREADRQAAVDAEEENAPPGAWDYYHPLTHKIPAIRRPDFLVTVRNLAMTGDGARLRVLEPLDLGRDQTSVDEALAYLRDNHVEPEFWRDPPPPVVEATQQLLDRVLGRGVCHVAPSGTRLRRYGHTDLVTDEAGGFTVYVSGRKTMAGVVRALLLAVRQDGLALGINDPILSQAWCLSRVAREIVVNLLALPKELADQSGALVGALIQLLSDAVDRAESQAPGREVARALVALPYLVGLREARREPRLALEGMGLSGAALDALVAQLETATASPSWLLRLADLAGEDWDSPDGYQRWRRAAEADDEVGPRLNAVEVSIEPDGADALAAPSLQVPSGPAHEAAADLGPVNDASLLKLRSPLPEPAAPEHASAFASVDAVIAVHTARRRAIDEQLREVIDRRAAAAKVRHELEAKLKTVEHEVAAAAEEEERVTDELNALADEEAADRYRAVLAALADGAMALDASAATWSAAADARADHASLAAAERTIADFDAMERGGLLEQLPAAVRSRLTADAETARAALHAMLGGRDPIRVPVVVTANAEPHLCMQLALPFAGRSELGPGCLHTSLALAIARVVAETVQAVNEALEDVEHETLTNGVSIVRLRFAGPPPVLAEECAQFLAMSLSDLSQTNASLREAGVSIEARVEASLETVGA